MVNLLHLEKIDAIIRLITAVATHPAKNYYQECELKLKYYRNFRNLKNYLMESLVAAKDSPKSSSGD